MRRSTRRNHVLAGVLAAVFVVFGIVAVVRDPGPVQEPGRAEHCFAEWCIAPQASTTDAQAITVTVRVRSDARQASLRPDHPQAWVVDAEGRHIGGPRPALDGVVGAGDSYVATLIFHTSKAGTCPTFLVSEGAWPSFLGLGYRASPFTAQAEWRLCQTTG